MTDPKIILFDIETINLKADLSPILCFGWKDLIEHQVHSIGLWDFSLWEKSPFNDRLLCKEIYKILSPADAYVAHYGQRFDLKFINTRLAFHNMNRLPPVKLIDTWRLARDNLLLTGNRLKNLCSYLKCQHQKMASGGWQTWLDVVNKDPIAIKKMTKYNKEDVLALQDLFIKLRCFSNKLPNYNLFNIDKKIICNNCGSSHLNARGYSLTQSKKYRRYQCKDCGSWGKVSCSKEGKTTIII
jgi:uncharacterized protein YprB with RNaseH-like and TPR domain